MGLYNRCSFSAISFSPEVFRIDLKLWFVGYDTQREITQCVENTKTSFLLETSRFADFSEMPIPNGAVRVRGLITKTYNGSDLVLALNTYEDITPDDPSCSE